MKRFIYFTVCIIFLGAVVFPTQAAFSNLYIFGDSLSSTTGNSTTGPLYYGQRYSNGRVWVEVLAQRQGLTYNSNQNWSAFANYSIDVVTTVSNFNASDASNALFIVWVNNADLYYPAYYDGTSMTKWTSAINQSQTNHFNIVTNLYAKGARTLIMPNAVDLSTIPEFNDSVNVNFIHLRCLDYNVAFSNTLNRIRASCPNLTLYTPDFFTLLTNILAHPANYGVTNALCDGVSIDAIDAVNCDSYTYPSAATNGYGTNYIFWDPTDPTAMVHAWMANLTQQLISPAQISEITVDNGDDQVELDLANVPIGQNGLVMGCTNLAVPVWMTNATFLGTNLTQSVFVTNSGSMWFYRLSYLYSWKWP